MKSDRLNRQDTVRRDVLAKALLASPLSLAASATSASEIDAGSARVSDPSCGEGTEDGGVDAEAVGDEGVLDEVSASLMVDL